MKDNDVLIREESIKRLFFCRQALVVDTFLQNTVRKEIEALIAGMGFALVELRIGRTRGLSHVSIVIYRSEGVGIDECAAVSRNVYPRLRLLEELKDISLEVTSPGIDRVFKDTCEYALFRGRGVRVLLSGTGEWTGGIIDRAERETLYLRNAGRVREIPFASIRKAKLDSAEEKTGGSHGF